jgi:hypothetical protein
MTIRMAQLTEEERQAHRAKRRVYNNAYYARNAEKFRGDAKEYDPEVFRRLVEYLEQGQREAA